MQKQLTAGNTIMSSTGQHLLSAEFPNTAFGNGDLKAGLLIYPLVQGGIIAGKLELMLPGQLQNDPLGGARDSGVKKTGGGQKKAKQPAVDFCRINDKILA